MKKLSIGSMLMLLTGILFAQPGMKHDGPPKPPPPAERWHRDSIRMQFYVNLSGTQIAPVKNAFITSYQAMDVMAPKPNTPPPAKEVMEKIHQQMKAIHDARNASLKSILNADQFERFRAFEREILPPPPPPRPHPMNGGPVRQQHSIE